MRSLKKLLLTTSAAALLTASFGIDTLAQTKRPVIRKATKRSASTTAFTVPSGTRLRVRMNESLNSKISQAGDRFTVTVREPVYASNGAVVIPVGSEVVGKVDSVKPAVKGGKVGELDVSFIELIIPNGTKRTINGSLTELVAEDAKSDAEGTARGDKMKHRKVIWYGGGAGGGALLGAAIGGGKGALIGGLIGAGAGILGERLTKGEDAEVKSGTEFSIYLNRGVSLPKFTETGSEETYEAPATPTGGQTYIVQPGETLGSISRKFYGTSGRYMDIYNANRDTLSSPNSVTVGQTLVIP